MMIYVSGEPYIGNGNSEYWVVIPSDSEDMSRHFDKYVDAEMYGNREYGVGNYKIEPAK